MSSLTGRCDYGNHSVLDGYIVEEIFTHFRALIVQIVAAINDLIVAKRLVETLLYGCIQFVSERLRRRKCIRLLFPFIRFAKKQHYRRKDADVSDSQYIRYSFDQYLPSSSVVRDREFGEAFLTASQRLIYRWSYKLLGDEILLRQRLTAFKLARTRYFDLKFEQAIKQQKVEQIIILGAGFDTRGFRFEALRREYCSHNQGVQQRELVLHRQDGDVKKLFVDFSTTKASSNHEEFGDRDSQEQSSELNLLGEASSCYESLCSPSPKLCSSSQADCHHINVIELDSPEVQRQKIKFLLKHFPYSEAVKFSEGVLFVGCDFHDPQCLDSALDGSLLDPNRKTLIIAEGLMSTLKVEVVEGIFRSLRDFMLTSIEKKHDILQNESLMTSKTPTHYFAEDGKKGVNHNMGPTAEWMILFDYFTDTFVRGHSTVMDRSLLRERKEIVSGFPEDDEEMEKMLISYGMKEMFILNESKLIELSGIGIKNWNRFDQVKVCEATFGLV